MAEFSPDWVTEAVQSFIRIIPHLTYFDEMHWYRWAACQQKKFQPAAAAESHDSSSPTDTNNQMKVHYIVHHLKMNNSVYLFIFFFRLLSDKGSASRPDEELDIVTVCVCVSCPTPHAIVPQLLNCTSFSAHFNKAVSLLHTFLLNHHKLLLSILDFARNCWLHQH